nr:reverse transcriptase domain-containing protein [Tanacetum cinerariifolium]
MANLDDEPVWEADCIVASNPNPAITIPATLMYFPLKEDNEVPLIIGRPFLHTADAVICVKQKQLNLGVGSECMIFSIDSTMKHSYSDDDTYFSLDVIDEILEEDFDALLDEGSKILYSIKGSLLEDKIFSKFDEFIAMNIKKILNLKSLRRNNLKTITFDTYYKIKKSLDELPTDLELKPLPDHLEYAFLEEPYVLPILKVIVDEVIKRDNVTTSGVRLLPEIIRAPLDSCMTLSSAHSQLAWLDHLSKVDHQQHLFQALDVRSHPNLELSALAPLLPVTLEHLLTLALFLLFISWTPGKLTNLMVEERFAFNVSLRMFTRSIIIQQCVEDLQLGVESYQKKLNLTNPDTYHSDLKRKEAYTTYSNLRGFIYQNKDKQNRVEKSPVKLTNEDIKNSAAYKEYYAIASGAAPPKTKVSIRKTKSSSDTTITPTTAAGTRLSTSAKGKQPAKSSKAKGLTVISEVAMTEAEQMKLATKRSLQQTHISQASGSDTDEGTGIIPGVPDVPTDESDEEISWKSSDEDDERSDYQEDDDDQDDDDQDDNDDDQDTDNDDDDFAHPKLSIHEEEAKDEERFDPIVQTPRVVSQRDSSEAGAEYLLQYQLTRSEKVDRNKCISDKDKQNRLMRIDEMHKFNDGTLNDFRTALDDHLKGIRIKYLPQAIWRRSDKERAAAMI